MKTPLTLMLLASAVFGLGGMPALGFETVVVDAGHGGNDEGTKWYHVAEKDVTLAVSQKLAEILRSKGIAVELTRTDDRYVPLIERAEVANRAKNSLLVSIHFNSSRNHAAHGFQTYHFFASPSSEVIARSIQGALSEKLGRNNRGVLKNDFAVLTRTNDCAVLVECGFISNKKEAMYFASKEGQQALATALAAGIMRVKPVINNDPPSCGEAKSVIVAQRDAAAARKLLLSGLKKTDNAGPAPTAVASVTPSGSGLVTLGSLKAVISTIIYPNATPTFASMLRDVLSAYSEPADGE